MQPEQCSAYGVTLTTFADGVRGRSLSAGSSTGQSKRFLLSSLRVRLPLGALSKKSFHRSKKMLDMRFGLA